jgi:hypothetical protein
MIRHIYADCGTIEGHNKVAPATLAPSRGPAHRQLKGAVDDG